MPPRSSNDRGMQLFKGGRHSEAFDAFTEAIRLCPTSPVYHCNRAAAALKLGQAAIAAEDAANAARRDPAYLRAHLRGGLAQLRLRQAEPARHSFQRALELDPSCAAAAKGLADAAQLAEELAAQLEAEAAAARGSRRAALPRGAVPEEEAVLQLLSAEQMLAAHPRMHSAACARVEALLLCQRYADAEACCTTLLEGSPDRRYLQAEAAWRQGRLQEAADQLKQAVEAGEGSPGRCSSLMAFVGQLRGLQERAEVAEEEGRPGECVQACTALLALVQPAACVGLACSVLRQRAEAHAARRAWEPALADVGAALALDPAHAGCLRLRAEVNMRAGHHTACFLDLQELKKVLGPSFGGTPALTELLLEAARLSLNAGPGQHCCGDSAAARAGGGGAVDAALRVLGIPASASTAQARQAYLKLAARWHPDKWAGAAAEQVAAAEARFKEVQQAYELLTAV